MKDKIKLGDEDKEALKAGAKTFCYKFTTFIDKFTELIFCKLVILMISLLQYAVYLPHLSGTYTDFSI